MNILDFYYFISMFLSEKETNNFFASKTDVKFLSITNFNAFFIKEEMLCEKIPSNFHRPDRQRKILHLHRFDCFTGEDRAAIAMEGTCTFGVHDTLLVGLDDRHALIFDSSPGPRLGWFSKPGCLSTSTTAELIPCPKIWTAIRLPVSRTFGSAVPAAMP